jgi:predicted metal-dependent phosphotriesterase family hydrolase
MDLGRDVGFVAEVAQNSRVNIVCATIARRVARTTHDKDSGTSVSGT